MNSAYATLFLHCLRFDLFESGPERDTGRFYSGTLGASLLATLCTVQVADLPLSSAIPALFLFSGILAFFGILGEVGAALLDPRDLGFLAGLPLSSATYFRARLSALSCAVLLRVLSFGVVPAVVFSIGGRGPWYTFASYLLTLFLLFVCLAGLAVFVFLGLRKVVSETWLREVLIWVQVGLFVAGTAGWLFLFSDSTAGLWEQLDHAFNARWVVSNWFADVHLFLTGGTPSPGVPALAGIAGLMSALAGFLFWLGRDYVMTLASLTTGRQRRRRSLFDGVRRLFVKALVNPEERGGFLLGLALLRRERTFRLQSYPLLAYPIVFLWFGRDSELPLLFGILFSHLAALYLPLAGIFLKYSDSPDASWLCSLHQADTSHSLWLGVRKAMIYTVVVPLSVAVVLMLAWQQGLVGVCVGVMSFCLAALVCLGGGAEPVLPFSQVFSGAIDPGKEVARVYPVFFLIVLAGGAQFWGWRQFSLLMPGITGLGLAATLWWIRRPKKAPPLLDEAAQEAVHRAALASTARKFESNPFPTRLRQEVRGLLLVYGALALFGAGVGLLV